MPDDSPKPRDDDAWIERVVNLAGHLGFDRTRLRWKLVRWQAKRGRAANLRAQEQLHVDYAHKTCGECGALQAADEKVCTRCGAKLGRRGRRVLARLGITAPRAISMSTLLAVALLVTYARTWVAAGGGLGSPSARILAAFGGRWPPLVASEPWRLVTSVFLHAGLLHLAFNVISLAQVGPRVEQLVGRATMLGVFVVTGVVANLGTLLVGEVGVGIGASGAIMGLIGVAAASGQRNGTRGGLELRNAMLAWAAYTIVFGFAVGADNWAHLFGFLAGAAVGYAVPPRAWLRPGLRHVRTALGVVGAVAALGAVAIILTRTPPAPPPESPDRVHLR